MIKHVGDNIYHNYHVKLVILNAGNKNIQNFHVISTIFLVGKNFYQPCHAKLKTINAGINQQEKNKNQSYKKHSHQQMTHPNSLHKKENNLDSRLKILPKKKHNKLNNIQKIKLNKPKLKYQRLQEMLLQRHNHLPKIKLRILKKRLVK